MTDLASTTSPAPDAVVRYAAHPDGILDLHLPTSAPRATVVLLHGGFWRAAWDRRHTRPVAAALRAQGYLVATPEYRRTGRHGDRAGGWPTTFDDVRAAVSALPELVARVGVHAPAATYAVGHSAGGHLALWLASEGFGLERVVALAPVGDLADAFGRHLGGGAVRALLGGTPADVPDRFAAADPAVRLRKAPGDPVLILHGTADEAVPVSNSDWARGLDGVQLQVLDGVDHFALIDPTSAAWRTVVEALSRR